MLTFWRNKRSYLGGFPSVLYCIEDLMHGPGCILTMGGYMRREQLPKSLFDSAPYFMEKYRL